MGTRCKAGKGSTADDDSCSGSCSEAPPADELDPVVLVVSALRPAAEIDALEGGAREVVAHRESEGAGRPPAADLGLELFPPPLCWTCSRNVPPSQSSSRCPRKRLLHGPHHATSE